MTHEEIRARLLGALDRTLDPHELDEVERHMAGCADCRLEQVELHRMRRSLDREERAREEAAPGRRSRWGPLGATGILRVLILGGFTAAALLMLLRRTAAPPAPPPGPDAWIQPTGPGVLAGPEGGLRPVEGKTPLAPGERIVVPSGLLAVISLRRSGCLVLQGPAAGILAGPGSWRHGGGRALLAASGPLRLLLGAGALSLSGGQAAVWDASEPPSAGPGAIVALLEGAAAWEGPEPAEIVTGQRLRLAPWALGPERLEDGPAPEWVEALRGPLVEAGTNAVIPFVRLFPGDAP